MGLDTVNQIFDILISGLFWLRITQNPVFTQNPLNIYYSSYLFHSRQLNSKKSESVSLDSTVTYFLSDFVWSKQVLRFLLYSRCFSYLVYLLSEKNAFFVDLRYREFPTNHCFALYSKQFFKRNIQKMPMCSDISCSFISVDPTANN